MIQTKWIFSFVALLLVSCVPLEHGDGNGRDGRDGAGGESTTGGQSDLGGHPSPGGRDVEMGSDGAMATSEALVEGNGWHIARGDDDLFADPDSPITPCGDESYREEYGGVEVTTGRCEHISLVQPLRLALTAGDPLRVVGWHSNLFAPDLEPAMGRIALAVGARVVWEESVDIPAEAAAWDTLFASPVTAAAGTLITLHVQNHGSNSWNLLSFERDKRP